MNTSTIRSTLVFAVLMAASTCATADPPSRYDDVPLKAYHRTVSLRGLDLSSLDDMRKLHKRLYLAARSTCDGQRSYPRRYITEVLRPCIKDALDRAVAQIRSPVLTAFHVQKSQAMRLTSNGLDEQRGEAAESSAPLQQLAPSGARIVGSQP